MGSADAREGEARGKRPSRSPPRALSAPEMSAKPQIHAAKAQTPGKSQGTRPRRFDEFNRAVAPRSLQCTGPSMAALWSTRGNNDHDSANRRFSAPRAGLNPQKVEPAARPRHQLSRHRQGQGRRQPISMRPPKPIRTNAQVWTGAGAGPMSGWVTRPRRAASYTPRQSRFAHATMPPRSGHRPASAADRFGRGCRAVS